MAQAECGQDEAEVDTKDAHDDAAATFCDHVRGILPSPLTLENGYIWRGAGAEAEPVCAPIKAIAQAPPGTDADTVWIYQLQFLAADGRLRDCVVNARDVIVWPDRMVARLVDRGFHLAAEPRDVSAILRRMPSPPLHRAVARHGWADEDRRHFVTPSGAVITYTGDTVSSDDPPPIYVGTSRPAFTARGDVQGWIDNVAQDGLLSTHGGLHAVAIAAVPPLLSLVDRPSFLMHLHGSDDLARACRQIATSVWSPPGALELSWSRPENELCDAVATTRDSLLILSGYSERHADKMPALSRALTERDAQTDGGRCAILSTGDALGADQAVSGCANLIELDARDWFAPDAPDALAQAVSRYHGALGVRIVEKLQWIQANRADKLQERMNASSGIKETMGMSGASESEHFARARSALESLRIAAVLLSSERALNLEKGHIKAAFQDSARAWAARQRAGHKREDRILIDLATRLHDRTDDRLADLHDDRARELLEGMDGWQDGEWIYLTKAGFEHLASEIDGATRTTLLRSLNARELLHPSGGRGNTYRMPSCIPGRPHVYRISRDIMGFAEG